MSLRDYAGRERYEADVAVEVSDSDAVSLQSSPNESEPGPKTTETPEMVVTSVCPR